MRYLIPILVFVTTHAHAENCKPIADALAKSAITPSYQTMTGNLLGKPFTNEGLQSGDALYVKLGSIWDKRLYDRAKETARAVYMFEAKTPVCTLLGSDIVSGQTTEHYSATEHLIDSDVEEVDFWISPATGLMVRWHSRFSGGDVTKNYDYDDIDAKVPN
jgi:hypothetical protein